MNERRKLTRYIHYVFRRSAVVLLCVSECFLIFGDSIPHTTFSAGNTQRTTQLCVLPNSKRMENQKRKANDENMCAEDMMNRCWVVGYTASVCLSLHLFSFSVDFLYSSDDEKPLIRMYCINGKYGTRNIVCMRMPNLHSLCASDDLMSSSTTRNIVCSPYTMSIGIIRKIPTHHFTVSDCFIKCCISLSRTEWIINSECITFHRHMHARSRFLYECNDSCNKILLCSTICSRSEPHTHMTTHAFVRWAQSNLFLWDCVYGS